MAKIQNISEIHPTLGFTEFDILEKYRKSFNDEETIRHAEEILRATLKEKENQSRRSVLEGGFA